MSKEDPATGNGADVTTQEDESAALNKMRERSHQPRNDALASILAKRNETLKADGIAEEMLNQPKADDTTTAEAQAAMVDNDAADAATQVAKQTDDDFIDPASLKGKKVKLKIDGVEQEVDASRLVSDWQKTGAADKRLAAAVEKERQAEEKLRAAEARATEPAKKEVTKVAAPAADLTEVSKKYHEAVYNGDGEAAAKLFQEAVAAQVSAVVGERGDTSTRLTDDELIARATAATTQQLSVDAALRKVIADYPSINADEDLNEAAAKRISIKRAGGMSSAQAVLEAFEEVAEKFKIAPVDAGRPETKTATTRDEKVAKKAGADPVPTASARATKAVEVPPTNSDIIAKMREARAGGARV